MEDFLKLWDELLKTVQTFTTWPLIALYLALLFRKALTTQIPALFRSLEALAERLSSLKYKGTEADFQGYQKLASAASPALTQQTALKLFGSQSANSFRIAGIAGTQADGPQQKIVSMLTGTEGQTHASLLANAGMAADQLDDALTQLIERGVVKPAFSKEHEVVFQL